MTKPLHRPSVIVLTACSVVLGLQHLRALQPQLSLLLRDRMEWRVHEIGLLALSLFAVGFLVSPLARWFGSGRALVACAGLLGGCRLAAQVWRGDPLVDFGLALGGCAAFFLVVPLLVGCSRPYGPGSSEALAVGWMLGLLADLTLHGVYGTWDAVWRDDVASLVLAAGLAVTEIAVALVLVRRWRSVGARRGDLSPRSAWAWVALGAWLFLSTVQLVNPARYGALLGASHALPWLLISVALLVALLILTVMFRHGGSPGILLLVPMIFVLVLLCRRAWPVAGSAVAQMTLGTVLASLMGSLILIATSANEEVSGTFGAADKKRRARRRLARSKRARRRRAKGRELASFRRLSLAHGGALLLFGLLSFVNSARFDIALPFSASWVFGLAAAILGVGAIMAARALRTVPPPPKRGWRVWLALSLVLAVPSAFGAWPKASSTLHAGDSGSLRIATYNLHCGVNGLGDLDLKAMAALLENERLDLVVLQEVSRGWAVNGGVDMVEWLARRLDMHFVFAGTADPLWGNAVLSRLPVLDHQAGTLASDGLLLGRGFLDVTVAHGRKPLHVVATHLHHVKAGGGVRDRQMQELIAHLKGRERTILAGDLNAPPDSPEVAHLRDLGWTDAFAARGRGDGFTNPSVDAYQRIDYVWLSPELEVTSASVVDSRASDHLPLVVDIAMPR